MNVSAAQQSYHVVAADVAPSAEMFICVKLPSGFSDGKYIATVGVETILGGENTYFVDAFSIDGATITVGVIAGNGAVAGDNIVVTAIAVKL